MTADDVTGLIPILLWVGIGAWWMIRRRRKINLAKQAAERRARIKAIGDNIRKSTSDDRPTMAEKLQADLQATREWAPRGDERGLVATQNSTIAEYHLKDDLGLFAGGPKPYEIDQLQRDILLAHARRDAAHALANTETLLDEMWNVRSYVDRKIGQVLWFLLFIWLALSGELQKLLTDLQSLAQYFH